MCTYHHHHHLQDHAEVFLMLFYSWGFCTNLSEFTKQGLASCVCKSLPPTTQHWKKAETPRSHTQAVQFILNKDPHGCSQYTGRQSLYLAVHLHHVKTLLYVFKAGFDIIKTEATKIYYVVELSCVFICLLKYYWTL